MKRFFAADIDPGADRVCLDREESRHLARVLRLQVGQEIEVFDGSGALYTAEIETLGKQVIVKLKSREQGREPADPSIIVCQGDLRGQKIDFLVEKCTELGVDRFIPFVAGRSQGRPEAERRIKRLNRRNIIVKTACKQSGRLRLMDVDADMDFADLIEAGAGEKQALKLFLWEMERKMTLRDAVGSKRFPTVYLMFGPEGGFSPAEADRAIAAGWQPVGLGDLILRAETATIATVAVTRHLFGLI